MKDFPSIFRIKFKLVTNLLCWPTESSKSLLCELCYISTLLTMAFLPINLVMAGGEDIKYHCFLYKFYGFRRLHCIIKRWLDSFLTYFVTQKEIKNGFGKTWLIPFIILLMKPFMTCIVYLVVISLSKFKLIICFRWRCLLTHVAQI